IFTGRTLDQESGHGWTEGVHPDDLQHCLNTFASAFDRRKRFSMEYRLRRHDGQYRWFQDDGCPRYDQDGQFVGYIGYCLDVEERKRSETALIRQKALYEMLSQCNQAVVRCGNREALFDQACRIAVDCGGFLFAWVGLARPGDCDVRPVARWGEDTGYIEHAHLSAQAGSAGARGPMGQAILGGTRVVSNDFLSDPATAPWHEAARRAGVCAMGAFPIREEGEVIGALALYAGEPEYFTEELRPTLDDLAADISFALDNLAREAKREAAERALGESERFVRATIDALSAHIAVLDESGTIIAVNRAWRAFAEANPPVPCNVCEGANYFAVCHSAHGRDAKDASNVASAIRAVIGGVSLEHVIEYTCDTANEMRWFDVQVTRFPGDGPIRVVVAHEDITERKRAEIAIQALLRGTATVGRGFLTALVRELATALRARHVHIAELLPGGTQMRTLAVWAGDKPSDNFDYDLAGTPCANLLGRGLVYFPQGVRQQFPQDRLLVDWDANAYLATLLAASDGAPLGLLAVVHDRPLADAEMATALLPIFGARVAAELERLRVATA
ncbi:MAG: GAF domain-containing protein, partial [Rhodocyclaceae bacterium]